MNIADALKGEIGENDKQQKVRFWVDTGFPPLNKAISGSYKQGFPVGRIVEMFGPESSGKTAIATQAMISAQKAGGVAWFNDHERSFMSDLAEKQGLDTENLWIFKTPDTFEQSVTTTIKGIKAIREKKLIPEDAPIVVVFDSLASMVPQSKFAKEVDEQSMNDSLALAKACSNVFSTLSIYAEKYQVCMIVLNQEREKPGVIYGDPTTTPGGRAPKFYSSVRVQVGRKKIIEKDGKNKEFMGQEITSKIVKNKLSKPFKEAAWRFMFREDGTGYFDVTGSMIDYLVGLGILKQSGARITWTDGKSYFKKQLIAKIDSEGLQSELMAMLPKETEEEIEEARAAAED